MAMFGVEADSITGRRLNAYLRDTSNTLALESVLQLLDVPTELALVPTTGFDVASISTARVFGNEDEELAQPAADSAETNSADAADSADEAQTSEALDVTFPLEDSVAEATFSESTPVEDDSFEDDEEIEPYPGNFPSPMERSYRLVATGRRVTLAEWMDAISEGHIPFEYTHMSFPKDALDEEEDFLDSEPFDDFEGPYEQDRDFDRDDAQPTGGRKFTPEEEEAILAHLRAALAPHSAKSATEHSAAEQSAASQSEANPAEDAPSDAAGSDDAPSENASAEDVPSQATQASPSAWSVSKKPASKSA